MKSRLNKIIKDAADKGLLVKLSVLVMIAMILTACGADELEDRCFPMLALVDYEASAEGAAFCYTFPSPRSQEEKGDDTKEVDTSFSYGQGFVEAWRNYENRLNKKADYNHLKVIVLGEHFWENQGLYGEMIEFMEQNNSFPRNAYVCIMPRCKDFLEIQSSLSDDAGDYLESYLRNHEKAGTYEEVTLGKLMDEYENGIKEYHIPYLTVENGGIVWSDWRIQK